MYKRLVALSTVAILPPRAVLLRRQDHPDAGTSQGSPTIVVENMTGASSPCAEHFRKRRSSPLLSPS